MNEQIYQNIIDLSKNRKFNNLFLETLSEIRPSRKSVWQYIFSFFLTVVVVVLIMFIGNIVETMRYSIEILNTVALAFIAIIFGTYAIFQALLSDATFWALLNTENNLLDVSNKSFLHTILLYLFYIIFNCVLEILLYIIPYDFYLPDSLLIANSLASILIGIYFWFSFVLIYEIKNFAVNLYQMFNVYNIYRALEVVEKREDD